MEGSVWNMVMKALSLPMAIGQTGLPGHHAPGPAEEGCPTETASALIPSKQVWISQLTSEHLSATAFQTVPVPELSRTHSVLQILFKKH